MDQTERYTLTIGVTPGYGHQNEGAKDEAATLRALCETGIRIANEIHARTDVFISFVLSPARVGYRHEWGCPEGGEFVVVFSGERNRAFNVDRFVYQAAWQNFAQRLKEELGQTTATLVRSTVHMEYLRTPK